MRTCAGHSERDTEAATTEERPQREAGHRAHRRLEFLQHLTIFVPVVLLILLIDLLAGDEWFVHWVAGIWGGILLIHLIHVFVVDEMLGPAMERRLTETQLRHLEERNRNS